MVATHLWYARSVCFRFHRPCSASSSPLLGGATSSNATSSTIARKKTASFASSAPRAPAKPATARLRSSPRRGKPLTDAAMSGLLTHPQIVAIPHSIRSSVETGRPRRRRAVVRDKVAAAYADRTCSPVGGNSWTIGRRRCNHSKLL